MRVRFGRPLGIRRIPYLAPYFGRVVPERSCLRVGPVTAVTSARPRTRYTPRRRICESLVLLELAMPRRNARPATQPTPKRPTQTDRPSQQAARPSPSGDLSGPMSPKAERLYRQADAALQRNEL